MDPRERIAALIDEGSLLETGRLAISQQPSVGEAAPADGLICGWARVHGREVAVLCEDRAALERTDAQVARNKRHRMLSNAVLRGTAIVYIVDGPEYSPVFEPFVGNLFGYYARQHPDPPLERHRAPIVAVVCGKTSALSSRVVLAADVRLDATTDDSAGMELSRRVLDLLPTRPDGPLCRGTAVGPASPLGDGAPAEDALVGVLDESSVVNLSASTGLARLDGWPVCYAIAGGDVTSAHMRSLIEVASLSARHEVPLLLVQDTDGYAGEVTDELMAQAYRTVRDSRAAKLVLIIGRGHALGDFAYGGRMLGVDTILCWPDSQVAGFDVAVYRPGAIPQDADRTPLLAAGLGTVDDIVLPSETRERLSKMLALLAPARAYPSLEQDRGPRLIDDIAKV